MCCVDSALYRIVGYIRDPQESKDFHLLVHAHLGALPYRLTQLVRRKTSQTYADFYLYHSTCSLGLMRPSAEIDSRLAHLPNLPDISYTWHAMANAQVSTQYRGNVLFRERCVINRLTVELSELLFSHKNLTMSKARMHSAASGISARLQTWIDLLPHDLVYSKSLAAPMFELQ